MLATTIFRPRRWIALAVGAVSVASVISFARAANTVTFQPGGSIPVRGTPFNLRPVGNSYTLPGGLVFGGFPQPVQVMPVTPVNPQGFGQGQTPGFNVLGGQVPESAGVLVAAAASVAAPRALAAVSVEASVVALVVAASAVSRALAAAAASPVLAAEFPAASAAALSAASVAAPAASAESAAARSAVAPARTRSSVSRSSLVVTPAVLAAASAVALVASAVLAAGSPESAELRAVSAA